MSLVNLRYTKLHEEHGRIKKALQCVQQASEKAELLANAVLKEKSVLDDKQHSALSFLSQLGQNTAIKEEHGKLLDKQKDKILQLEKSNPEVKGAYEKVLDSANRLADDIHKVVRQIAESDLSTLRQLQRPDVEVADVMAAVILVVKSTSYDLSWNKGAKRIMANLTRFVQLLDGFDKEELSCEQLVAVDQYIKKPFFNVDYLDRKSNIKVVPLLCLWVRNVVHYNVMMVSQVKPLKAKCNRTLVALEASRVKLKAIENKVAWFEQRLAGLSSSYESASIDKVQLKQRVWNMHSELREAESFASKMASQLTLWQRRTKSIREQEAGIDGSSAIAAGMAVYLGPFADHYGIRQSLLCRVWPSCLSQRGIPLVLPGVNGKGTISEISSAVEDTNISSRRSCLPQASSPVGTDITDYQLYCESLASILVSLETVAKWKAKGFGPIVVVNGAIMVSSGNHWPFVVDPQGVGLNWIKTVEFEKKLVMLNER